MNQRNRQRAAAQIHQRLLLYHHDQLERHLRQLDELEQPVVAMFKANRLTRIAHQRRWHKSTGKMLARVHQRLGDVQQAILQLRNQTADLISQVPAAPRLPSERELMLDLLALEKEFPQVDYDPNTQRLSVVTEPIVLESLHFGPFRIELCLWHPFRDVLHHLLCIALEPHAASCDDTVTHPHVRDDVLCTGEATTSLRHSIELGRIADLFMIVNSVLHTYNPHSPYIEIGRWDGQVCYDCDAVMSPDDEHFCEFTEHTYCQDCMGQCDCGNWCALGAMRRCNHTDDLCCPDCLSNCAHCGATVLRDLLTNDFCPDCEEMHHEEEQEQEQENATESNQPVPDQAQVA